MLINHYAGLLRAAGMHIDEDGTICYQTNEPVKLSITTDANTQVTGNLVIPQESDKHKQDHMRIKFNPMSEIAGLASSEVQRALMHILRFAAHKKFVSLFIDLVNASSNRGEEIPLGVIELMREIPKPAKDLKPVLEKLLSGLKVEGKDALVSIKVERDVEHFGEKILRRVTLKGGISKQYIAEQLNGYKGSQKNAEIFIEKVCDVIFREEPFISTSNSNIAPTYLATIRVFYALMNHYVSIREKLGIAEKEERKELLGWFGNYTIPDLIADHKENWNIRWPGNKGIFKRGETQTEEAAPGIVKEDDAPLKVEMPKPQFSRGALLNNQPERIKTQLETLAPQPGIQQQNRSVQADTNKIIPRQNTAVPMRMSQTIQNDPNDIPPGYARDVYGNLVQLPQQMVNQNTQQHLNIPPGYARDAYGNLVQLPQQLNIPQGYARDAYGNLVQIGQQQSYYGNQNMQQQNIPPGYAVDNNGNLVQIAQVGNNGASRANIIRARMGSTMNVNQNGFGQPNQQIGSLASRF